MMPEIRQVMSRAMRLKSTRRKHRTSRPPPLKLRTRDSGESIMSQEQEIKPVREKIDAIDSTLLKMINERIALAKEIGSIKEAHSDSKPIVYRP
ncbi:MAG: chorismate mutase, partial [Methylococcales bacterium]|nr:chorismate mutase [Methylococcales bacterium]